MTWRKSDWLIVLRGRESRLHGEAASGNGVVRGQHERHAMDERAFYAKRRTACHGNGTRTDSSQSSL